MPLPLSQVLALAAQCAPAIAPETLLSVVQVESGFNPLAIGVNGSPRVGVTASSPAEAAEKASVLIAAGRSVDLGLAQINSKNLASLGLSVEAAFDPCRNLAAAGRVLQAGYQPTDDIGEQPALLRALSRYNTGDDQRGFRNGYVAKVSKAAAHIVPALRSTPSSGQHPLEEALLSAPPPRPSWDVFGEAGVSGGFVIRLSQSARQQSGVQE
jgi:type IV secretion system protein VirB1